MHPFDDKEKKAVDFYLRIPYAGPAILAAQ
jgi:hypothetical protein